MLADHGHLELGEMRLEYRMIGPRPDAAPSLVLLHEGLGCVAGWGSFAQELAAATGTGVFVYSRAGYGSSSPAKLPRPVSFMHEEALDVLARVLDAIGFRRGLLVGHSDGASIAAIYAGSVQDHRVRGLVLMAPHFSPRSRGLRKSRVPRRLSRRGRYAPSSRAGTPIPITRSTPGAGPGSIPNSANGS